MSLLQQPEKLHRITYILVWAQTILGGVLLAACWPPITHGIFAALTAVVLVCVHKGTTCGTRVAARVIVSLFWVLILMLGIQTADAVVYGFTDAHIASLQDGACWFGGLFLCYLAPAATAAMLYHGEHTAGYDRLMACLILPALVGAAGIAVFTDADIPWTVGGGVLPYIWLMLSALTTAFVWISARIRTEAQQAVIDRRRQRREEKRAARIAKNKTV